MQKSKLTTLCFIIIILVYGLISSVKLVYSINSIYLKLLNPFFWILLTILIFFTLGKGYENRKLKRNILQYTIISVLIYIIIYMVSGLFVTFGKNPYNTNLIGLIENIWMLGVPLCAKEYIRFKLINNVYEKDKIKIATLISIVYIIIDIEYGRFIGSHVATLTVIKYVSQVIIPNIAKNTLFSYTAIYSDAIPAIVYQFITNLYYWVSPILPNCPWAMTSIIDIIIPVILFLYIRYEKNKLSFKRDRKEIINTNPGSVIPLFIAIILVLWFAMGIFPIKPIAIATGSMEKELCPGDIAIIKKCKPNDVNVGDIIEYKMEGYTVVHRIAEKKQKNGDFYFITKGDNNNAPDRDDVKEDQLIGKVIFKIKYLGYPALWFNMLQKEEDIVKIETGK